MTCTVRLRIAPPRLWPVIVLTAVITTCAFSARANAAAAPEPEVLTLDEASLLLRISPDELARLARNREIPGRRVDKQWRFSRQALLDWLDGDWQPAPSLVPLPSSEIGTSELKSTTGSGTEGATQSAGTQAGAIGEAPAERTAVEIFLRESAAGARGSHYRQRIFLFRDQ